jgi:hypothetical protein
MLKTKKVEKEKKIFKLLFIINFIQKWNLKINYLLVKMFLYLVQI